ncbi:MAG: protein translocase subunit SecD [Candidatus Omnitrophica bacterium]|nr:protein translocase subunit SecD [Candidatus Omnitrophota bacterium]
MIKRGDLRIRLIGIFLLTLFSLFYIFPLQQNINLGLDLKGGMYVLLKADTSGIPKDKIPNAMNGAIAKIRQRIDAYGVKEPDIRPQGSQSILVQVPGVVDKEIVRKLKEVGRLEFKLVSPDADLRAQALEGEIPEGYELHTFQEERLLLHTEPSLTGADLVESSIGFGQYGQSEVRLQLTSDGRDIFAEVTRAHVGKRLAILLDNSVISAPAIREPILTGEAQITGDFSLDEAKSLVSVLNSGALPVPLKLEEERSVGPLLGSDSIRRGISSIVIGAVLVGIFMCIYYLLGGGIAVVCLVLDLLFILAGLRLFRATLTLPGIAGMILTLGMAVDANVLIFERIREELSLKKPLGAAVKNGFDRAKRTIFDANITTLIAALFLLLVGTGPIKGFAITLSLGIFASVFTAVFVGRTLFTLLLNTGLKNLPMLKLIPSSHFNFIKAKHFCFACSLLLVAFGMFRFYSAGNQIYGVDFLGGQVIEYQLTPSPEIAQVRDVLSGEEFADVSIQEFRDVEGGVIIRSKNDIAQKTDELLQKNFDNAERLSITTVGPAVGNILKRKAVYAVILSLLGILVYVGFRFKHFDFAFASIIALFHDVLISLGFLAIFGYKINLLTVTALLTIAGYSINDTIVIYDRIREISPKMRKLPMPEIINRAINATVSRTLITSLTTLMVVGIIFVLGGEALRGFSFTLMVGILAGTYSSIYIASPLVLLFRKPHHKVY